MFRRGPSGPSSTAIGESMPSAALKRFRKSTIGAIGSAISVLTGCVGLAAADALHAPLCGGPHNMDFPPMNVVCQVHLADAPDVADQPVNQRAGRRRNEDEDQHERHDHHHLL